MRMKELLGIGMAVMLTAAGTVMAANITVWDHIGPPGETGEIEPDSNGGSEWWLEEFDFTAATGQLELNGNYDMINGVGGFQTGDMFFDVDGNCYYGEDWARGVENTPGIDWPDSPNGTDVVIEHTFGYEYALALQDATWTPNDKKGELYYVASVNLYALDDASTVRVYFQNSNVGSNPWRYDSNGDLVGQVTVWLSQDGTDLTLYLPDDIYTGIDDSFFVHYTYECGNDAIAGQHGTFGVPDGGLTFVMLGVSLCALALIARRRR